MWKESHANNVSDVNMSHNDKNTWLLLLLPSNKAAQCRQTACSTQRQEAPLARKTLQEKNIMQITSAQKKFHFLSCQNLICLPESTMKYVCCCCWLFIHDSISIHKSFGKSHLPLISTKVPTASLTWFPAPTLCSTFRYDLQVKHKLFLSLHAEHWQRIR